MTIEKRLRRAKAFFYTLNWHRQIKKLPKTENGERLLHIGCGEINAPGFINLDARPLPHIHFVRRNITKLPVIPDSAVDMIYMCHVLEHVTRSRVTNTLEEMKRILKPGGLLRLSVPDFDCIINLYEKSGRDIKKIAPALMGGQDYPYNIHYSVFNHEFLTDQLLKAGFINTSTWNPDACQHHDFEDWASRKIYLNEQPFQISLNLEARKPQHQK